MNIYFSCSITGGRKDQEVYQSMVNHLLGMGFEVPTALLARPDVMEASAVETPADVFQRDVQWIKNCDAVVAEISTPSHGVGYEIALALQLGKPVLCCYQFGQKISKMISGNDHTNLSLGEYANINDLWVIMDRFLAKIESESALLQIN